ncbi:kelch motif-containing protein [Streptomyces sp. ET3-23]|uniref:kelch motif-containing protein n=1 Tax=Streptomyces sp. ET3-23 TaxID=2885643 RepID=UPI001D1024B7|nr:kelch motif-containing protein [Streptomyces sp. ET3-23]MCC2275249.1 kelch motif-containing protein [Streptomyces sp. ET3-23]
MRFRPSRKVRSTLLGSAAVLVLAGLNAPAAVDYAESAYHDYKINQPEYKARYGHWAVAEMPAKYRLDSIHATLLPTGKVLLIAGSGNNIKLFKGGTFKSTLWDPVRNTFKKIDTPKDLFCGGHTQLPDGRLLVAGGTARYEVLQGDVKRAGGAMLVKNEDPDQERTFPKGTVFRSPGGKTYAAQFPVHVPRAKKTGDPETGKVTVTASEARVYVESGEDGPGGITNTSEQYTIDGLRGRDRNNFYGMANKLAMDKKDFQGIKEAYEFDPVTEKYVQVQSMSEARWYPTLVSLDDGKVLAVSGLDDIGQVVPGKNELYDPATRTWSKAPDQYFPTYPSLFLMQGGKVFYSGSNAGYGPADKGRTPGLWDLKSNTFTPVPGIKDPDILETSSSLLLPPAQDQKVMVLGGGGVGESKKSTARTAIVDLKADKPRFTAGPELREKTRYLNSVIMPDDTVFTTGGSKDYRGRSNSNILKAQFYHPDSNHFTVAADPAVGRDYHTEALLLPDGRVAVFGSDPLFGDKDNTRPGTFEQRVEVYTPPYLYHSNRPSLQGASQQVQRGDTAVFTTPDASRITTVRLIHPGSATHVTDVDQRSVALDFKREGGRIAVSVPKDASLVPSGWYMLFVTDEHHTPSKALWVHIR